MPKYIDKDTLIAEIERRKQDAINNCGGFKSAREHECDSCIVEQYEEMKNIINTLEEKKVDLNKEIYDAEKRFGDIDEMGGYKILLFDDEFRDLLRHFFELGLKTAQKGE